MKSGEMMEFGSTPDSAIEARGKSSIRVWALNRLQNTKGSYLTVSYTEDGANGEYRPLRIEYTANGALTFSRKVEFSYIDRSDIYPQYVGGSMIKTTKLLSSVKTYMTRPSVVLVRDYQLQYQTGTATKKSRLTSITECTASCSAPNGLPPNVFTWQEGGNGQYTPNSQGVNNGEIEPQWVWVGDYDGNGKMDWATFENSTIWTYLSNGNGTWQKVANGVINTEFEGGKTWAGDINGDGKTDIVSYENNKLFTYLSNGNGTYTKQPFFTVASGEFDPTQTWAGDFNGDGRGDLASYKNNSIWTYISNGNGTYTKYQTPVNNKEFKPNNVWPGDYNGDGKTDLATLDNPTSGSPTLIKTYLSTCTLSSCGYALVTHPKDSFINLTQFYARTGDFNSDGRTDLLSLTSAGLTTLFSKGDGTYENPISFPVVPDFDSGAFWPGDFNADGKTDIASRDPGGNAIHTYFSKGDGTYQKVTTTISGSQLDNLYTYPADYTGDGKADLASYKNATIFTHVSNGPYPDLATTITNMFGGTNTITYKPITDNTVYAKDTGAVYPKVDLQYPLYVVSNLVVSDGVGSTYSFTHKYGGAKADHLRGPERFRWMETNDVSATNFTSDARTTTFYKQSFPHTGMPDVIEIDRISDNKLCKETFHTYHDVRAYAPSVPTLAFAGLQQLDVKEWECTTSNRLIRTTYEYDGFTTGNLTRSFNQGDTTVTGDERDERSEWVIVNNSTTYMHRPKRVRLLDGNQVQLREKWFFYDNQAHGILGAFGLLTKEETNAGGGMGNINNPVFTYTYDSFGNRATVTDPRGCTTTTIYETTHNTFPSSVAVCSNVPTLNFVTTYSFDPKHGVVLSRTDPFRAGDTPVPTTTFEYDALGRLKKETNSLDALNGSPNGTVSYDYVNWGIPSTQKIVINRTEEHGQSGVLWSEDWFDGLGKMHAIRNEGPDPGQIIETTMDYDSRDLVKVRTVPHFVGVTGLEVKWDYDVFGKETKFTHADNNRFVTRAYSPGLVTITNENGKVKRHFLDAYGQLTRVEEVNGSETYVTQYAYDAAGSLTSVINHLGHATRMKYDPVERKEAMCDPNMGTPSNITTCTATTAGAWVYTYSSAGDLGTQKDATNPLPLDFTYDQAGRILTKKSGTTTLASYTYDDPAVLFSKGRLTQVVDQSTTTKFSYDPLGRVSQTQRLLLGTWFSMSQTYDALGRIKTETFPNPGSFPDGEQVTYTYNNAGWVKTASNYINNITYNARGQKTTLQYFNGVTSTWNYFDQPADTLKNFLVKDRLTGTGNSLQDLHYTYDNVGNITAINDNTATGTADRTFLYDDLNRLTHAEGTFGTNQAYKVCDYVYSSIGGNSGSIGNITNKCGVTFSYNDPMHPSAVTSISTGKNYSYNANGHMITAGPTGSVRNLTWDVENRLSSISIPGGGTTSYHYDYTGMRVEKDAPSGTIIYPFKGYEINATTLEITKFIRIGTESFASKRGTAKYFYHNDHLGGVHVISNISGVKVQLNEYDPWGAVSRSEGTVDPTHRFTGQELDPESGIYYYGGRYYDPELGRFISPDPFVPDPGDPQSLNRYTYVLNNPVNLVDPDGFFFEWIGAIVAAIAKAVSAVAAIATPFTTIASALGFSEGVVAGIAATLDAAVTAGRIIQGANDLMKSPGDSSPGGWARNQCGAGHACVQGSYGYIENIKYIRDPGQPTSGLEFVRMLMEKATQFLVGDAEAAGEKDGLPFPPNPNLVKPFKLDIFPKAKWAPGIQKYRRGNMTVAEHISYRHGPDSRFTNVSKFSKGTSLRDVHMLVDEAMALGVRRSDSVTYNFGRIIGTNPVNQPATRLRIYLNSAGEVMTAFPY